MEERVGPRLPSGPRTMLVVSHLVLPCNSQMPMVVMGLGSNQGLLACRAVGRLSATPHRHPSERQHRTIRHGA